MIKNTRRSKSIKSFKIIVTVLALTVLSSLFYIYKSSERSRQALISLRQEKAYILKDLEKSELFLSQIMTSNKSLTEQLVLEHDKVVKLILQLKNKPITSKIITVYKQDVSNIDDRVILLLKEIDFYRTKIDSTNVVLKIERNRNDTLTNTNKILTKKVSDASKLYYYDLKTAYFKVKSSGKQIETDKASRADLFKISFAIAENEFAKSFKKVYYVQIIDPKNNIIGQNETKIFGYKTLEFGAQVAIDYQNKTTTGEVEISVKDLEEGFYTVNIFDESKKILTSNFILK